MVNPISVSYKGRITPCPENGGTEYLETSAKFFHTGKYKFHVEREWTQGQYHLYLSREEGRDLSEMERNGQQS